MPKISKTELIALLATACLTVVSLPAQASGLYTPLQTSEVSPAVNKTLPHCTTTENKWAYPNVITEPAIYVCPKSDMDHSELSDNWEACESANAELAKLMQDMSQLIDEMIIDELSKDRAAFERCKAGSYMLHAKDAMQKARHQLKDAANAMAKERLK